MSVYVENQVTDLLDRVFYRILDNSTHEYFGEISYSKHMYISVASYVLD